MRFGGAAVSMPEASREAVLDRVARFERDGLRFAVDATADNGYPAGLRTDKARFDGFRALARQRSGELRCGVVS